MPDRDFYYLVGLRFVTGSEHVERSFWADGLDGERVMWEMCLRELKAIGNAQVVSYGAYETRFLRQMKARYIAAPEDVEFVDLLIQTSVNLLGIIYGKIYFPTFSNSLKEIAHEAGATPRAATTCALGDPAREWRVWLPVSRAGLERGRDRSGAIAPAAIWPLPVQVWNRLALGAGTTA